MNWICIVIFFFSSLVNISKQYMLSLDLRSPTISYDLPFDRPTIFLSILLLLRGKTCTALQHIGTLIYQSSPKTLVQRTFWCRRDWCSSHRMFCLFQFVLLRWERYLIVWRSLPTCIPPKLLGTQTRNERYSRRWQRLVVPSMWCFTGLHGHDIGKVRNQIVLGK